jgi:two-component system cell cycle sensor histidine kinase/response regulator CckA
MAAMPGTDAPLRLLVVEDNPDDVELIRIKLEGVSGDRRFAIESVDRLSSAVRRLKRADVVLLDLGLPDAGGIEAVVRLSSEAPEIPLVVLTGRDDAALGLAAVREGAQDYLVKDKVDGPLLDRSLRYAVERKRAEQALARLAAIMGAICYDCGRKLSYDSPNKGFES